MTIREEAIGRVICEEISKQAKSLNIHELILLRQMYSSSVPYERLPAKLRERFRDIGIELLKKLPTIG